MLILKKQLITLISQVLKLLLLVAQQASQGPQCGFTSETLISSCCILVNGLLKVISCNQK